mmetsp:Transcript_15189/g.19035  ORF Transcript_15189/g.19035 Transcript_15189/m.19035 type:complete len:83 (-) Transcript_15189:1547-1795(-)
MSIQTNYFVNFIVLFIYIYVYFNTKKWDIGSINKLTNLSRYSGDSIILVCCFTSCATPTTPAILLSIYHWVILFLSGAVKGR